MLARASTTWAGLYHSQGRYAEAEPFYSRALAIAEKTHGPEHPDVARSLNNLAELYRAQGLDPEARATPSACPRDSGEGPGTRAPGTWPRASATWGGLYHDHGNYAEAEPLHQRALAIVEKALGPEHPSVATGLNNLAEVYSAQGRYAEAEPLHKRALAIREKALGPEHPDVAQSLNNLSGLLPLPGPLRRGRAVLQPGAGDRREGSRAGAPQRGHAPQQPGGALSGTRGNYAEAEPLHRRALAINEQALGPEHPLTAISLDNLAVLYNKQGRYAEAEPLYKRTLAIFEKALGPEHPDVAMYLENYAKLLRHMNRGAEATDMELRAKAIREKSPPSP